MTDRKKILFVITALPIGGAQMMLFKLLKTINRERFDATVVSLSNVGVVGDQISRLGYRVVPLNISPGAMSIRGLFALRAVIKAERPDIIQGWMYHANVAAQLAAMLVRRPVPVVTSIRATYSILDHKKLNTAIVIWMGAKLSGRAHATINNSRFSATEHRRQLGYSTSNVVVIPNGFDTAAFRPDPAARARVRASLGIPEGTLLVGIIGRVEPIKDHGTFLRAARLVRQQFPNARFLLVGAGAAPSNAALTALIRECGLENSVYLLSECSDMPELTAALDLSVLSSLSEGFPNVVGEAMSCAVCAVATATGDTGAIIGRTGGLAPVHRPEMLADAMSRVLAMEPEQRRNLGYLARARIVEKFSLEAVVRQYEAVYERVLSGTAPSTV